jgi:hypothetical protein
MNCGADLSGVAPSSPPSEPGPKSQPGGAEIEQPHVPVHGTPPASEPPPPEPPTPWTPPIISPSELPPTAPEWKMSSAGPLPEPPKRRRWLWILLIIIVVILILCCVAIILGSTVFEGRLTDFATRVSREATESAR